MNDLECDGGNCKTQLPWRITKTNLLIKDQSPAPFNSDRVFEVLQAVLTGSGSGSAEAKAVEFRNLCQGCWNRQSTSWDGEDYTSVRARTVTSGIFLNINSQSFKSLEPERPNKEAILSCICHELMHFWSHDSKGLQELEVIGNVNWDEAVADILGYEVYSELYRGDATVTNYVTPYNHHCQLHENIRNSLAQAFPRLCRDRVNEGKLPSRVRQDMDTRADAHEAIESRRPTAANVLAEELRVYLFKWFIKGPGFQVHDGNRFWTASEFLRNLGNAVSFSKGFPAPDGTDHLHAKR